MPFTEQRYLDNHLPLGYSPKTGKTFQLSDVDRYSGLYVIGKMGTGKSSFLVTLILHDIMRSLRSPRQRRRSVIVIDPHGDLVDDVLSMLPRECLHHVFVLDMEDVDWPFGLNAFAEAGTFTDDLARSEAMERIYRIFETLWPEVAEQQYLPTLLRSAIAIFLDNPGTTLVDMMKFFRDPAFRASLMANVKDRSVVEDFEYEFERLKPEQQATRVAPLMNRLRSLFVGRSLVRNILGQRQQSLNFRRAIDNGETLLIKLPTTRLASDAQLLGMVLFSQLSAAIFSYADTPKDQRPGASVYVDEVQNFATTTFKRIFSESRKFGAQVTVAHQWLSQLPGYLQDATAGARTTVCFRINPEDGPALARRFPASKANFEPSRTATKDLQQMGTDLPHPIQEFVETYLRGLGSGEVQVQGLEPGFADYLMTGTTGGKVKPPKIKLPNPTSALDNLFLKVMQTGDPTLPIPENAVMGLCNGGLGFYVDGWFGKPDARWLVQPLSNFPPHLAHGTHWLRSPEDKQEQFIHCIFHLRLTMHYLAAQPIGKEASGAAEKIVQVLTQLPVRTACAVSADTAGTLYTFDTPAQVQGVELTERKRMVRDQSRARYCAKREEVYEQPTLVIWAQPQAARSHVYNQLPHLGRSEEIA